MFQNLCCWCYLNIFLNFIFRNHGNGIKLNSKRLIVKFWVSLNWRFSQFQVSIFEVEFLVYSLKGTYASVYYFYINDGILCILFYNLPLVKPTKLPGHVRTIWFFLMTSHFPLCSFEIVSNYFIMKVIYFSAR